MSKQNKNYIYYAIYPLNNLNINNSGACTEENHGLSPALRPLNSHKIYFFKILTTGIMALKTTTKCIGQNDYEHFAIRTRCKTGGRKHGKKPYIALIITQNMHQLLWNVLYHS